MSRQGQDEAMTTWDALLLVSFGGPEGPDEVLPFLRRVTAGRDMAAEVDREFFRCDKCGNDSRTIDQREAAENTQHNNNITNDD